MQYRCSACGCYLDPGEGQICDDCRTKQKEKSPGTAATEPGRDTENSINNKQVHNNTIFLLKGS